MKHIFTLWLLSLLPLAASAQFPGRIHNLSSPENKTTRQVTTTTAIVQVPAISNPDVRKAILESKSNRFSEEQVDQLMQLMDSVSLQKQVSGLMLVETKEIVERRSRSDSMIAAYHKVVGADTNITIGPAQAKLYRSILDKAIKANFEIQEKYYDSLSAKKTKLPALDPEAIQQCVKNDAVLKAIVDTIEKNKNLVAQARNYFHYLYRSEENPVCKPWVLPLRSITHAEFFYFGANGERLKLLTNFAIQSNFTGSTTVNSEILSGILPFEIGGKKNPRRRFSLPLKFDLGTTVSQNSDTATREKTADKLLYGGLLHARVSYPFFYSNWKYYNGRGIQVYIPIEATFNWENIKDGSNLMADMYFFGEIALHLNANIDIIQSMDTRTDAALFFNGKFSYIDGGRKFHESLSAGRSEFWLLQLNGGVRVKERFTIAVNVPAWCSKPQLLSNKGISLAVLIDPNFK